MGKYIGRSFKYNRSKISSPTLEKPVLSSSANHTSYTTNSTPTIMSHQLQHKDSTSIQNTVDISNTYDIHSCVTPRKQNICVQATSTPPSLTPLIINLPILPIEVPKTTHLPPLGKEYLCFQVDNKSPHASQCVKSRVNISITDDIHSCVTPRKQNISVQATYTPPRLTPLINMRRFFVNLETQIFFTKWG